MADIKINTFSEYWQIVKEAVVRFAKEDTINQAAALAFYAVFSIPPMLFIIFWLAELIFDASAIKTSVFNEFGKIIGEDGSVQIRSTIENISFQKPNWWQSLIGIVTLLITSSTVFVAIKSALNSIFEVHVDRSLKRSIWVLIRDRFISISMLAIIAFILVLSLIFTSAINESGRFAEDLIGKYAQWMTIFDSFLLNLVIHTVLFAMMFRYLPDSPMRWRDTWLGGFITAILFVVGKLMITIFVGNSEVANLYDAAGSIMVLMLWIYYTSAIFLFGATITRCRVIYLEGDEINNKI